jgi:hypothetical protein
MRIKEMEDGIKKYSQLYSQLISNYKEQQEKLQQYLSQPTQKTGL